MGRRLIPTLVIGSVLGLVMATSASAAPTWLSPLDLSVAGQDAADTQVAVDPQGDSFAVWRRFDGSNYIVQGAVRPAGGSWSMAQNLSALGFDSFKEHVDVAPDGTAVAVWYRRLSVSDSQVETATFAPGVGAWGAAEPVSGTGTQVSDAAVGVGPRGDAVAIWYDSDGTNIVVRASRRAAGSSTWSSPKDVSTLTQVGREPRVAVDAAGNAVAVYVLNNAIVEGATLAAGATEWSSPKDLSDTSKSASEPDVAVDPSGNATAVWSLNDAGMEHVEEAALAAGASTWTMPQPISANSTSARRQHIVIDGAGNAYVSWRLFDGANYIVQAAMRLPGGSWSTPQRLSTLGKDAFRPDLAVDSGGDSTVVWEQSNGTNFIIDGAARPAGAAGWGAAKGLSAEGQDGHDPRVGMDAGGDATAIWNRSDGSHQVAQAAGYDAAGPQLRSAVLPASGKAFTPIAFSVAPIDVWSAVSGVSWSFGDGTPSAGGASLTHTFGNAGSFPVTVSATDSLGNGSSLQGKTGVALPVPVIRGVGQSASVWREGPALPRFSRKRKLPVGTTFRFKLNEPATMSFVFKRRVSGRRMGRRCLAQRPSNKVNRKCTRLVVAGRLARAALAGTNKLRFQGRVSRHNRLKLGRYTLVLRATNASAVPSKLKSLSFRIVR